MKKRQYGHYDDAYRAYWIGRMDEEDKAPKKQRISIASLAAQPGAPPLRTLKRWKKEKSNTPSYAKRWGRPATLSQEQQSALGGKLMSRAEHHLSAKGRWISAWLAKHYGWAASTASVSRIVRRLGFKPHRWKKWLGTGPVRQDMRATVAKLKEIRRIIRTQKIPLSNVVSMDQIMFWNESQPGLTYSAVGGGQPAVVDEERRWKDIVYTSYRASGDLLPPLIFTGDTKLTYRPEMRHLVHRQKDISGPGGKSSQKWLEVISRYMHGPWLLIVDNRGGSHDREFREAAEMHRCQIVYLNPYAGKLISVNDNPLHSLIRRAYNRLPHRTHWESIDSILTACRSVSRQNVIRAFNHVGITSPWRPERVVAKLFSEGFRAVGEKKFKFLLYRTSYSAFKIRKGAPARPSSRHQPQ